jgi:hypothetical protein
LAVGDGGFAFEVAEAGLLARIVGLGDSLVEQLIDRSVDAAHEKARHARHRRRIAAPDGSLLQARHVGLDDPLIDLARKQQRDVDVDAFRSQRMDRRQARRRSRHLDHQVPAIDLAPETLGFGDGALRVHRDVGRDLDADEAVRPLGRIENRTQNIGSMLDVLDGEALIEFAGRAILHVQHRSDRFVVFVGMADRLFEDRGVRSDPMKPVVDQSLQTAVDHEPAREKIEPHRLTVLLERVHRIHCGFPLTICILAICILAAAITFSSVKPNFASRSLSGADAPNLCIPMIAPSRPT